MLTKKIVEFSADLLDTVRGVLGEAKKCPAECECEKCKKEDDVEEGYVPTADEPSEKDKKTADKVRALLAKEKKPVKEEVEQIDELSKKTLGSYVTKAARSAGSNVAGAVATGMANGNKEDQRTMGRNYAKRLKGIDTAAKKLTKEEQDFIDALNDETFDEIAEAEKNLTGLPKSTAEKNKQYIEVIHVSGNKKRVPVHPTMAYKALNRYRNDVTTKSARIVSEETEITEARGRPRKAGAKDFTVHPITKEKLMHNNPEHMAKIEKLQKNGVLPKPKTEAGQHIINQLRKASTSMTGGSVIHFTHGESTHVPANHARRALDKYADLKPHEKEDFQKKIGHSHAQMMKHI